MSSTQSAATAAPARVAAVQNLRRSNAAAPHRSKRRPTRAQANRAWRAEA